MPTVELIRDTAPVILPMQGRSKGDHVSVLIHELCLDLGFYKEDEDEVVNQARFELGNAWEFALIHRLQLDQPDRYIQPGELELDGIFGTPDLLDIVERADNEMKATWMSAKNGPGSDKFWKYERQMMAYCHMIGWSIGILHVAFINGDYPFVKFGPPMYRVWRYKFTDNELRMNWKMLMNQARRGASKRKHS